MKIKLEKTSVKEPLTISHEIKDGKVHVMATAMVENLYLIKSKVIDIDEKPSTASRMPLEASTELRGAFK